MLQRSIAIAEISAVYHEQLLRPTESSECTLNLTNQSGLSAVCNACAWSFGLYTTQTAAME
jgi:hypothetical protein